MTNIQGHVSVYQGYTHDDELIFDDKPIHEDSNLIVDGFKEHVVDMLTRIPYPSSVSADPDVSASYNVSNFTIHGMTLSPNESGFKRINSLAAASGYVADTDAATTSALVSLDPSSNAWSLNPYIPNYAFSSVNTSFSGSTFPNSGLKNPTLSAVTDNIINGRFRDISLDESLSSVHMNEILSLYELNGWNLTSFLRYAPSATEFSDAYKAGSCARYPMSSVSGIYSALSGVLDTSTYAEPDDGILYIRSFEHDVAQETSGQVKLTQTFKLLDTDLRTNAKDNPMNNVLVELGAQFSSVSGGANANIRVGIHDDHGNAYSFSAANGLARHTWYAEAGDLTYTDNQLVLSAPAETSGTLSHFINVPASAVDRTFTVIYRFLGHDASDIFKCYFWNASVNTVDGWNMGNIFSGTDIKRVWNNDYRNPSFYIGTSAVQDSVGDVVLSSTTYITQPFKAKPLKKYTLNTYLSSTPSALDSAKDTLNFAVMKTHNSNTLNSGRYNYLTASGCKALNETRLIDSNYAQSPYVLQNGATSTRQIQSKKIKPSDLCLEVSANTTVSGAFSIPKNKAATLRLDALQDFDNGVSSAGFTFRLQTSNNDASGNPRYFNFTNGLWSVSSSSTSASINVDSSSLYGTGFTSFVSIEMLTNNLLDVVEANSSDDFDFILSLVNNSDDPTFVKNIKVTATAPNADKETREIFKFDNATSGSCWEVISYSGQNTFSGLGADYLYPMNAAATDAQTEIIGAFPIEFMFNSSGSIHEDDSQYAVFLFSTETTEADATTAFEVKVIDIVDAALIPATETITGDVFTSESYCNAQNFDLVNTPFVEWENGNTVYQTAFPRNPGAWLQTPNGKATTLDTSSTYGLFISAPDDPAGTTANPSVSVSYVLDYSSVDLPVSATDYALSFLYNQAVNSAEPVIKWQAAATTNTGEVVWWSSSTSSWDSFELSARPLNEFRIGPLQKYGLAKLKFALTSQIDMTDNRFDDTTKVKFKVTTYDYDATDYTVFRDLSFYTVGPFAPLDLPVFPTPTDTTTQPVSTPAGELGHYTNQLAYPASFTGIDYPRMLGNANWTTSAGLAISGAEKTSMSNQYEVVNSDGYVLFGWNGALSNKFYVNGFGVSSDASSISYLLDVSSLAMDYFEFQGGVGAIGLHFLDTNATYKKLLDNGHSISAGVYDKGASPGVLLYNLSDRTRDPVFKLASKKVFRTPIAHVKANNNITRFVWKIRLI